MGFLIPPWYDEIVTSPQEVVFADIVLGFFLAVTCFAFAKAASQTATRWHRLKKFTAYLVMVWVDWAATILHSIIGWCVGHGTCAMYSSFWLFFSVACVWTIEMHCLAQILVNRVSLLLFNPSDARRLKLLVFVVVFVLTTSVTIVWIPARMQISERWIDVNDIWDRGEKVCFLIFDVALNVYFVHLVRSTLIANGLVKYQKLYWSNIFIITLGILLDVAVIGTTWLPDYWIYIQFRPLTHMIKLYIEMCNAELIGRVAQASANIRNMERVWSSQNGSPNPAVEAHSLSSASRSRSGPQRPAIARCGSSGIPLAHKKNGGGGGICRTRQDATTAPAPSNEAGTAMPENGQAGTSLPATGCSAYCNI